MNRTTLSARIPPLPDSWPYQTRKGLGPWTRMENQNLGDLGADWIRVGPPDLDLSGAPSRLGEAFGRGGVHRRGQVVLRPYRRGGAIRQVNERTYFTSGRFQKEADIHRALWENGFPTVEPMGFAFRPHYWGVEGIYFTRHVDASPWARDFGRTGELLPQLAALLGSLSAWGLHAPDLNATNFIIDGAGSLLALDWDRADWSKPGKALREAYLSRLDRSLHRLDAPAEIRESIQKLAW
ncbi:MAG: hypothetical protein IPQ13_02770 [Holophagaceae bacterium]|nr:hypothetical protein [Holophagaceae bacterium]